MYTTKIAFQYQKIIMMNHELDNRQREERLRQGISQMTLSAFRLRNTCLTPFLWTKALLSITRSGCGLWKKQLSIGPCRMLKLLYT